MAGNLAANWSAGYAACAGSGAGAVVSLRTVYGVRLPRDSAIAMLTTAFPVDTAQAEQIMGSVGQGFEPQVVEEVEIKAEPPKVSAMDKIKAFISR